MTTIPFKSLHRKWMKNPKYKAEYDSPGEEFALIGALIEARHKAGLTQAQLASRMKTMQAAIARWKAAVSCRRPERCRSLRRRLAPCLRSASSREVERRGGGRPLKFPIVGRQHEQAEPLICCRFQRRPYTQIST